MMTLWAINSSITFPTKNCNPNNQKKLEVKVQHWSPLEIM